MTSYKIEHIGYITYHIPLGYFINQVYIQSDNRIISIIELIPVITFLLHLPKSLSNTGCNMYKNMTPPIPNLMDGDKATLA